FQAEDGIRDRNVTGVQTCALPILQVMHAADPVVVSHPLVVRELVPLDAAEDVHLTLVLGLELGDGGLVQGGAAGAHAVFPVAGEIGRASVEGRGRTRGRGRSCETM